MQAIAREFNLSETVFVLKPENPAHSARIRIFTPARELSFAGHPTTGVAVPFAQLRAPATNGERDAIVALEEGIGTVRVGACRQARPFAEFDAPKLPEEAGAMPPVERLAAALGLIPSEIGFENHRPTRFSAGNTFAFVPIASLEALARARANAPYWAAAFGGAGAIGAFLYTRQCVHNTAAFHARMFAPDSGVPEARDGLRRGQLRRRGASLRRPARRRPQARIEQGYEMGRPSLIYLTLVVEGGRLASVRIGGHAVRVAEGRLTVQQARRRRSARRRHEGFSTIRRRLGLSLAPRCGGDDRPGLRQYSGHALPGVFISI